MSRSLPKPKIIYKNLQDIIRNSSYNKHHNSHSSNKNTVHNNPKHYHTSLHQPTSSPLKKSTSRHSIASKQKINVNKNSKRQKSLLKEMFKDEHKDIKYEHFCTQAQKIYSQMQATLKQTKNHFTQQMKNQPLTYNHNLQQLTTMSRCLKQLLTFFTQTTQQTQQQIPNRTVLTQITTNDTNISKLSLQNQKRRKNNRLGTCPQKQKQNQHKKPTIYQLVLMKKI